MSAHSWAADVLSGGPPRAPSTAGAGCEVPRESCCESSDSKGCPCLEASVAFRRAWQAAQARPADAAAAPQAAAVAERVERCGSSEASYGLGRCPSTANLQGLCLPRPVGPSLARESDTVAHSELLCDSLLQAHEPAEVEHQDAAAAGPAKSTRPNSRAPLGEITNTRVATAAGDEPKHAKPCPPTPPDHDPQLVKEYTSDVMRSMLQREEHFMPRPNYMQDQPQINAKMRSILNDWLFEVHRLYGLRRETLFLTVSITDRYLSHVPVSRQRLQLVGVSALLIAAKFEEIEPPELADLVYVTADSYTKQEIVDTEMAMLSVLSFEVAAPTAANFMRHFQAHGRILAALHFESQHPELAHAGGLPPPAVGACDEARGDLAWYLLELALLDIRAVRHAPSHLAAAALLLANRLSGQRPAWPASLARLSGYVEKELEACACELGQLLEAAPQSFLQAMRSKYRHTEMLYRHPA